MPPKVALLCRSQLLEQSLKKFLNGMIAPVESADILVTDHEVDIDKPLLRIGLDDRADLKKPFSRSQLMIKLEEKAAQSTTQSVMHAFTEDEESSLEEKIGEILKRYTQEVIETVKEHYETKS